MGQNYNYANVKISGGGTVTSNAQIGQYYHAWDLVMNDRRFKIIIVNV